jgi:hypothetical protein
LSSDLAASRCQKSRPSTEPLSFVGEDGFDGCVEKASQFESEGEAGIELSGFDGVDGLAGDFEVFGEVSLTPITLGAEDTKTVLH